jgi:hypothetical protein
MMEEYLAAAKIDELYRAAEIGRVVSAIKAFDRGEAKLVERIDSSVYLRLRRAFQASRS